MVQRGDEEKVVAVSVALGAGCDGSILNMALLGGDTWSRSFLPQKTRSTKGTLPTVYSCSAILLLTACSARA